MKVLIRLEVFSALGDQRGRYDEKLPYLLTIEIFELITFDQPARGLYRLL